MTDTMYRLIVPNPSFWDKKKVYPEQHIQDKGVQFRQPVSSLL